MLQPLANHPCPHCGTATEGPPEAFCCHGCESASALLSAAGLEGWYAQREQPAPRSTTTHDVAWDTLPVEAHEDGTVSACLAIDGLRCASCVWVTEQLLRRTDGVAEASVSFANGKARLRWDPATTQLSSLMTTVATLGYQPRPNGAPATEDRDLLLRLGVATFGAANVMGMAAALYVGWLDGMDDRFAQLLRWLSLLVATPVATWAAAPFFTGAWAALRVRVISLDLPIAIAVAVMYAHGVFATVRHTDGWLDSLTMLVALLLGGRLLEARGRRRTAEAATSLAALVPRTARRVVGDRVELISTEQLAVGDRVALGSGDEVPADGVVVDGAATARMALLTGEAEPVRVEVGDRLVAGAVIEGGACQLAITHAGSDTLVARLAAGLDTAGSAPRTPSPADRLAPLFTVGTIAVAGTAGLVLAAQGQTDEALMRAVAILVVACPCALALAGPLVGAAGLAATARRGLLLRSTEILRRLADVDTVVLDKTGTLTLGRPRVTAADDDALRIAAGLERSSRHPIALAILDEAAARGVPIPDAQLVHETAGRGIEGVVDGVRWRLGAGGPGVVVLDSDDGRSALIHLADRPRPELASDIAALQRLGVEIHMLTGDHADPAAKIAAAAGINSVISRADPEAKLAELRRLAASGRKVLFVGDGINDAAALSAAHVGVAMADGSAPTLLAADGVLSGDRLRGLSAALQIARQVKARAAWDLGRSAVYNLAAVVAAVAGLVNPLVAAILMPLSSSLVIASAARVEVIAHRSKV